MGKGKERAEAGRDGEEEDDVSRRSEEDSRSSTSKVGEGEGTEESSLTVIEPSLLVPLENAVS
ncbi:MAG: hypothetical protein LAP86_33025 [Acidobacteriia bacterium]|nr:hypothetical protein [Terriglobia bacterium]